MQNEGYNITREENLACGRGIGICNELRKMNSKLDFYTVNFGQYSIKSKLSKYQTRIERPVILALFTERVANADKTLQALKSELVKLYKSPNKQVIDTTVKCTFASSSDTSGQESNFPINMELYTKFDSTTVKRLASSNESCESIYR